MTYQFDPAVLRRILKEGNNRRLTRDEFARSYFWAAIPKIAWSEIPVGIDGKIGPAEIDRWEASVALALHFR
jgi:hypothetical protein